LVASPTADRHVFSVDEPTNPGELYAAGVRRRGAGGGDARVREVAATSSCRVRRSSSGRAPTASPSRAFSITRSTIAPGKSIRSRFKRMADRRLPTSSASAAGATTFRC
jgi:hypothetical protein